MALGLSFEVKESLSTASPSKASRVSTWGLEGLGEGRGDKGLKVQIDLEKMLYNVWLYLVLMKLAGCCRVMELCIIGSSYGLCGAV